MHILYWYYSITCLCFFFLGGEWVHGIDIYVLIDRFEADWFEKNNRRPGQNVNLIQIEYHNQMEDLQNSKLNIPIKWEISKTREHGELKE